MEDNLVFERMRLEDIDAVVKIEEESFPDPWTRKMFESETRLKFSHFYVCKLAGSIIGYAGIWHVADEAHINNIAVSKDYRGRRIGEKILKYILRVAKELNAKKALLEVRAGNHAAISLYKKYGFRENGLRKGYYKLKNGGSENAVLMEKTL